MCDRMSCSKKEKHTPQNKLLIDVTFCCIEVLGLLDLNLCLLFIVTLQFRFKVSH